MSTTSSLVCLLGVVVTTGEEGSSSPIVKIHAYQREIVSGIPGLPPGKGADSGQKQYSIYLETNPESKLEVGGVWMNGKKYSVTSVIKPTPVRFDNPVVFEQEERNIAVPKTKNQVTEITVNTPMAGKTPDQSVAQLLKENEAVVELTSGGNTMRVPVKAFQKRDPVFRR